jgi:hypothetical protein
VGSGGVSAAEFVEGDPTAWVVGVGDSAESPVAFVVVGVDFVFGWFGVGEQTAGLVTFRVAFSLVLQGEAAVVFGFHDPVVVLAQQLPVADAGDPAAGARLDVIDIAAVDGFVAARGMLAVAIT